VREIFSKMNLMKAKAISQLEEEKLSNLILVSIVGKDLNEMNFNKKNLTFIN